MHRAVLLSRGPTIDTDAILLTDSGPAPVAEPAPAPVAPYRKYRLRRRRRPCAAAGYAAYGGGRIMAPPPPSASPPAAAGLPGNLTGLVGRTVAAVERSDHRHAAPLRRQPHPRRHHPRHFDQDSAEQAEAVQRGRCCRPAAGRCGGWRCEQARHARQASIGNERRDQRQQFQRGGACTAKGMLIRGDIALAIGLVMILVVMILPMPSFLLDILLALSMTMSVLILMTVLFIQKPLEISSFRPSC